MDKVEKIASIVLPNQLFEKSPVFSNRSTIYLVEESLFFNQYVFHKQKLFFHRLSMKKYQHFLGQFCKGIIAAPATYETFLLVLSLVLHWGLIYGL